ncbi:lamin-B1.S-like isoform X3 [Heterodontus francisci]|uniref:lamin-B1.S-like isoform X3 n=1 Tax=Heterodontus francisci TaxID=7792 RepID=UPI00355AF828
MQAKICQGHSSWLPQTRQIDGEMEMQNQALDKQLQFTNREKCTCNQIKLLASEYQARVISLNRGIERKGREIQRLKARLAEIDAELFSARHPEMILSAQLVSTWLELQDAKTTLLELQAMHEEEAAQKVRLCEQIQHLTHQLEVQSVCHSKDLHTMSERIERSKVLVRQFDERIGRGYDDVSLKNVLESLRERAEFEMGTFQDNITQAYDQNVATLIALQTSDQILLDQEMSEKRQLQQCTERLRDRVTGLHSQVLSEEAHCQKLAAMFRQECHYNQHCLQTLQEHIKEMWQQLCVMDEKPAVQTAPLPPRDETEKMTTQRGGSENRAMTCVKIQEVDSKGCFVQISNTSCDRDANLSGYTLQQRVGGYPISLYRFPQHTWIPAQRCLKVWAAVADIARRLPSDIVWKEQQRFRSGPECTTALCKSNGQVIAWYIPSHRFSAAANSFDAKGDASEDWVPPPLNEQQIPQAFSPHKENMKEDACAPSPEMMFPSDTLRNGWTDFVTLQKRGSIPALFSSKDSRPQSNTSSLTEQSSLWSHSLGETDICSYLQSSLISLPSDSLPGLVTPNSSSPQSPVQMSRRSNDAEGLNLTVVPTRLDKAHSLSAWVTQRNTRPKYGLRFMSYPLFTTDTHVTRR